MAALSASMPPTAPLRQTVAVTRAEGLRQLGHDKINKLLDALVDMSYECNASLTTRERVCRFCNKLETLTDVPNQQEIAKIIELLRSAFGLEYRTNSFASPLYAPVKQALYALDQEHSGYGVYNQLRPDLMFFGVHGSVSIKKELSKLIAQLFIIAMNIENEQFRSDVKKIIDQIMDISFEWM